LDAPVLENFAKKYLRDDFKKFLKETGQTFEIAKQLVGLTDGRPADPKHNQPCPITGCQSDDDSFYFYPVEHTFHCSKCNFTGDLIELIKRVGIRNTNVAKTADRFLVTSTPKVTPKKAVRGTSAKQRGPKPAKVEEAKEWLIKYFRKCHGTILFKNMKEELRRKRTREKFSEFTIRTAAKKLGVKMEPRDSFGPGSGTRWTLSKTVWDKASPSKKGSP